MLTETDQFIIGRVQRYYVEPAEIPGDRTRGPRIPVGIRSASLYCKKCGHVWRATEGKEPGQFQPLVTAPRVSCPKCGTEGELAVRP